jgi:hypothetical protein
MTCRGKVKGGVVVLENPALLPEGTSVEVRPIKDGNTLQTRDDQGLQELRQALLRWAGKATGLPADMARNHDHYLHGRPKK